MPDFHTRFSSVPVLFYLAGIFIACFSAFLIMGKSRKITADYILAIWFLIIGVHLAYFVLFFSGAYVSFPYLLGLEIPFPLIHGPMLYLYILCLTGKQPDIRSWLLHMAPAIIVYIILLKFLLLPAPDKLYVYLQGGSTYTILRHSIKILIILSGILYVTLSVLAVKNYKKQISERYSNTEKINLNWVYYLITGIALIWIAVIIRNDILIFSFVDIFIMLAAYFGISRVGILELKAVNYKIPEPEKLIDDHPVTVKYEKTFAGEDTLQQIYEQLSYQMKHKKLYKDPELDLNQVAALLNIHPNTLSQTINYMENKNFYDYINRQRIEEFKRIVVLPENQKFTILSLAFESGFNSKTSFNRNFKKYMNCAPREFLKHYIPDSE
ncbi:AraC family transcriptional regulator [Elizabethkingia meningoseptica]|uniref:AraC family transcriptional regulator n=1 Tax=Elizabethkingia meningoseptica TaxID=238 RepID=UPI000936E8B9|nr:helix-turn-helix domain-containing protein [Elizabethkingia meningoseptica]